jgi:predicted O-methyltransferase YrrM
MDRILKQLEESGRQFDNVPRSDGRFLEAFVLKTKRKNALEIGSANGYSAIWIGRGMRENRGRLHTIENSPSRARQCRENIRLASLEATVNCIEGEAMDKVKEITENVDFLFLDMGPVDMLSIVQAVEAKLTDDAIIALHNIHFEQSYARLFEYATSRGWTVEKHQPGDDGGYGFFIVSKK